MRYFQLERVKTTMLIREMALELKLPYLKDNYEDMINQAKHTSMNYEEFLLALLEKEYELRKSNGVARRLRYAKIGKSTRLNSSHH